MQKLRLSVRMLLRRMARALGAGMPEAPPAPAPGRRQARVLHSSYVSGPDPRAALAEGIGADARRLHRLPGSLMLTGSPRPPGATGNGSDRSALPGWSRPGAR